MTIIRSKAPLRLGLAGGGTDVAPYSEIYGGAVLNATISLYAYATIIPITEKEIRIFSQDKHLQERYQLNEDLPTNEGLSLHKGVINHIRNAYGLPKDAGFELYTTVDAPPGSGLGTSSTLTVTILGAFAEWLKLPLGEYDLAKLAYQIERDDLAMAGGKQDQYAATFGGVNYMEFHKDNNVIVNPLRVRKDYLDELSHNLVLYYTATSRLSSKIIESQSRNVINRNEKSIEAMHQLKEQSRMMKEALLKGNLDAIGEILDFGWKHKKRMSEDISNKDIEEIYDTARLAGATGGKISGAGGGGFMIFYCPAMSRDHVIKSLEKYGGYANRYEFVNEGLKTWTMQ